MTAATIFQAIELLVVSIGVFGGLAQLRNFRRSREREAALALMQSFHSPNFSRGLDVLFALPEGLTLDEVRQHAGPAFGDLWSVSTTLESLGVLVYRGEASLDMVEDFFSGVILLYWRKLGPVFLAIRRETGRETIGEWMQWLAERLMEVEDDKPAIPAHIAHRDWKPKAFG